MEKRGGATATPPTSRPRSRSSPPSVDPSVPSTRPTQRAPPSGEQRRSLNLISSATTTAASAPGAFPPRSPNHVKRPLNAFMLWAKEARPEYRRQHPGVNSAQASKQLGAMWKELPEKDKTPYVEKAEAEKNAHMVANPGYKYCPRRRVTALQKGKGGEAAAEGDNDTGEEEEQGTEHGEAFDGASVGAADGGWREADVGEPGTRFMSPKAAQQEEEDNGASFPLATPLPLLGSSPDFLSLYREFIGHAGHVPTETQHHSPRTQYDRHPPRKDEKAGRHSSTRSRLSSHNSNSSFAMCPDNSEEGGASAHGPSPLQHFPAPCSAPSQPTEHHHQLREQQQHVPEYQLAFAHSSCSQPRIPERLPYPPRQSTCETSPLDSVWDPTWDNASFPCVEDIDFSFFEEQGDFALEQDTEAGARAAGMDSTAVQRQGGANGSEHGCPNPTAGSQEHKGLGMIPSLPTGYRRPLRHIPPQQHDIGSGTRDDPLQQPRPLGPHSQPEIMDAGTLVSSASASPSAPPPDRLALAMAVARSRGVPTNVVASFMLAARAKEVTATAGSSNGAALTPRHAIPMEVGHTSAVHSPLIKRRTDEGGSHRPPHSVSADPPVQSELSTSMPTSIAHDPPGRQSAHGSSKTARSSSPSPSHRYSPYPPSSPIEGRVKLHTTSHTLLPPLFYTTPHGNPITATAPHSSGKSSAASSKNASFNSLSTPSSSSSSHSSPRRSPRSSAGSGKILPSPTSGTPISPTSSPAISSRASLLDSGAESMASGTGGPLASSLHRIDAGGRGISSSLAQHDHHSSFEGDTSWLHALDRLPTTIAQQGETHTSASDLPVPTFTFDYGADPLSSSGPLLDFGQHIQSQTSRLQHHTSTPVSLPQASSYGKVQPIDYQLHHQRINDARMAAAISASLAHNLLPPSIAIFNSPYSGPHAPEAIALGSSSPSTSAKSAICCTSAAPLSDGAPEARGTPSSAASHERESRRSSGRGRSFSSPYIASHLQHVSSAGEHGRTRLMLPPPSISSSSTSYLNSSLSSSSSHDSAYPSPYNSSFTSTLSSPLSGYSSAIVSPLNYPTAFASTPSLYPSPSPSPLVPVSSRPSSSSSVIPSPNPEQMSVPYISPLPPGHTQDQKMNTASSSSSFYTSHAYADNRRPSTTVTARMAANVRVQSTRGRRSPTAGETADTPGGQQG